VEIEPPDGQTQALVIDTTVTITFWVHFTSAYKYRYLLTARNGNFRHLEFQNSGIERLYVYHYGYRIYNNGFSNYYDNWNYIAYKIDNQAGVNRTYYNVVNNQLSRSINNRPSALLMEPSERWVLG
jgi:hypothetical protein